MIQLPAQYAISSETFDGQSCICMLTKHGPTHNFFLFKLYKSCSILIGYLTLSWREPNHSTICFHNMIFIFVFPKTKEFCSLIESLRTINIHENKKNSKWIGSQSVRVRKNDRCLSTLVCMVTMVIQYQFLLSFQFNMMSLSR